MTSTRRASGAGPSHLYDNHYFIHDEPEKFQRGHVVGTHVVGAHVVVDADHVVQVVRADPDTSWSEECDQNSVSVDSGYYTSFNTSNNDDSIVVKTEPQEVVVKTEPQEEKVELASVAPLVDTTNRKGWHARHGLVKIENPAQQIVTIRNPNVTQSSTSTASTSARSFGFYGHMPVKIQPKPLDKKRPNVLCPSQQYSIPPVLIENVSQQQAQILDSRRRPLRSRKSPLVPKIDDYHPEYVKPSQELLAARRLLEEAIITGNIVSQARYARINRRLDKMRVRTAQRATIMRSFSQEEPPNKRSRLDEKAKCSRALYQENKRVEGRKFTWRIGIHGPHKSFNRLAVRRSGKKKRRSYLNRTSTTEVSDESDENEQGW